MRLKLQITYLVINFWVRSHCVFFRAFMGSEDAEIYKDFRHPKISSLGLKLVILPDKMNPPVWWTKNYYKIYLNQNKVERLQMYSSLSSYLCRKNSLKCLEVKIPKINSKCFNFLWKEIRFFEKSGQKIFSRSKNMYYQKKKYLHLLFWQWLSWLCTCNHIGANNCICLSIQLGFDW